MKVVSGILILAMIAPVLALATGDQKGNGGNVIVCQSAGKITYELLDLYEGRVANNLSYVPAVGTDVAEIFEQRIKNLEHWNPRRANLYRTYFKEFKAEALFLPEGQFTAVGDTGPAVYPKECELKQIVVQWDRPTPAGYRYFINQDLWNPLSGEQKAALLLHEFIYREGRLSQNNFGNSLGVRYYTAYIHSDLILNSTLRDYVKQLGYVGFQEAEAQGMPIWLYTWNPDHTVKTDLPLVFHSDNVIALATLADHFPVPKVLPAGKELICRDPIQGEQTVVFFENGTVFHIQLGCDYLKYDFTTARGKGSVFGTSFYYNEQGQISAIGAAGDLKHGKGGMFTYQIENRTLIAYLPKKEDWLSLHFFPDGQGPQFLQMSNYERLLDSANEISVPRTSPIYFSIEGGIQK